MATPSASSRIPELDGLRGIAISLVVLIHYFYWGPPNLGSAASVMNHVYVWFERCVALGWTGVDLFFVLSGFLIGGILIDSRDSENYYKAFYMRRFYRILPIYYLTILGYIILLWTLRPAMRLHFPAPVEAWPDASVLWLFAFVQNFRFTSHTSLGWHWFSPTWSLAVEEQFYLVAPLLVRRLSRRTLFGVLCAVVVAAPAARMWVHFHLPVDKISLDLAYILMPCRADSLAIGILLALLWRTESFREWLAGHHSALYGFFGVFLGGVVVLGLWSPSNLSLPMESVGYTWIALFYGSVLMLVMEKRSGLVAALTRLGILRDLGRVSYCFYLLHSGVSWLILEAMAAMIRKPALGAIAAANCASAIVVYALAKISWRNLEDPLLRRGHAYRY